MTRTPKTPRQRAAEALGVEERRVKKLTAKWDALMAEAGEVGQELKASEKRRDHLKTHPDLQPPTTTNTGDDDA